MAGGRPLIFPVNYVVDGKTIVFRTDEGAKLNGVTGGLNVAFASSAFAPIVDHKVLATVRVMPSRAGVRSTPALFTVA